MDDIQGAIMNGSHRRGFARLAFSLALLSLVTGFRSHGPAVTSASRASATLGASVVAQLEVAARWRVARPLLSARGQLVAEGEVSPVSPRSARMDRLVAKLPARADGTFGLCAGALTRPLVRLRRLGIAASTLELADGHAVFRDVVDGVESLWTFRDTVLEQVLIVHRAGAWRPLVWELERRPDLDASSTSARVRSCSWTKDTARLRIRERTRSIATDASTARDEAFGSALRGSGLLVEFSLDETGAENIHCSSIRRSKR
jgi:hypothetical protein